MIETGGFLTSAQEVGNVVVGVSGGRPVYLRDVAEWSTGRRSRRSTCSLAKGRPAGGDGVVEEQPAVTLTVAKRPGTNAISVADGGAREGRSASQGRVLPADVAVTITRHYGETAAEKSNELLLHMGIAVVSVSLLIMLTLGWRESIIVGVAIPSTLALTLLVFYLYGFTLNRITLFALIFTIGILVDDAIVVVENIMRHLHLRAEPGARLGGDRGRGGDRGGQSDHSGHLGGDCGGAADGVRRRPDGSVHAADPDRRNRGDVLVACDRLHGHAVGGGSDAAVGAEARLADAGRGRREPRPGRTPPFRARGRLSSRACIGA